MDKVKYPNGSQVNFETLVDLLQSKAFSNLKKRIQALVGTKGIFLDIQNGEISTDFQASFITAESEISVNTGIGLTASGEFLSITTPAVISTIGATDAVAVIIKYKSLGSVPVKAMNAFVYDQLDGTNSLSRKTQFEDSIDLVLTAFSGSFATFKAGLSSDEIPVAVYWDNSTANTASTFSLDSFAVVSGTTYDIADVRSDERILLSDKILSDTKLIRKDRDSVGDNSVDSNVEFSSDIRVSGILKFLASLEYSIFPEDAAVVINSPNNELIRLEDDVVKIHKIRINRGTEETPIWEDVITKGSIPSKPQNFRIVDIYPTPDKEEKKGYIQVKWNWDGLEITDATSNWIDIKDVSFFGESITFSAQRIADLVDKKKVYFPITGDSYEIDDITALEDGWRIALKEFNAADEADWSTVENDARIIDAQTEYYQIAYKATSQQGKSVTEVVYFEADKASVKNPTFVHKLELGREWTAKINAVADSGIKSITVDMVAGAFDASGSPFTANLPNISPSGTIELTATLNGFDIIINGWKEEGEPTETAHEFEILYSDTVILTDSNFSNYENAERLVTPSSRVHISAARPTRYSVIVRPLQNKRPVGASVAAEVNSGGGGISPTENTLFENFISIDNFRGKLYHIRSSDKAYFFWLNSGLTGEPVSVDFSKVAGKKILWPTISSNQLSTYAHTVSSGSVGTIRSRTVTGAASPNSDRLEFYQEDVVDDGDTATIEADTSSWATIETNVVTLDPDQTASLSFSVFFQGMWKSRLEIELVDNDTDEVLKVVRFHHIGERYDGDRGVAERGLISFLHQGIESRDIKVVFRGWMDKEVGYTPSNTPDESISILLVDNNAQGNPLIKTPYIAHFGPDASLLELTLDSVITGSTTRSNIISLHKSATSIDGTNDRYRAVLDENPDGVSANSEFILGALSKDSRFISERTFEIDYEVTGLEFTPYQAEGVSPEHPGIIRVYPKNSEGSGRSLKVEGPSTTPIKQATDMSLKSFQGERVLIIDAFDPDTDMPNNYAQLEGKLVVTGKPIIQNSLR